MYIKIAVVASLYYCCQSKIQKYDNIHCSKDINLHTIQYYTLYNHIECIIFSECRLNNCVGIVFQLKDITDQ